MKKLIVSALISLSLISLAGCGEKENTNTEPVTKCEAGKCDTAMEKSEMPVQKSAAPAKSVDN